MNSEPIQHTPESIVPPPAAEAAASITVEQTVVIIAPDDPNVIRERDKATLGDGLGTRSMTTYLGNAPQIGGVAWGGRAGRDGRHG